ncbi:MAG: biopolymer transporter [Isosphaeraceae bacterium]|nr:biopolymer transporter [Isosphaeraceae bacterium]
MDSRRMIDSSRKRRNLLPLLVFVAISAISWEKSATARPIEWRDRAERIGRSMVERARTWFTETPPAERVVVGGLFVTGIVGCLLTFERLIAVRRSRFLPGGFLRRFEDRLGEGRLERGKALDLCELNPSPAAKIALAAIKRWGRPVADLERAVSLAIRTQTDRLDRRVGTIQRLAVLSCLLGVLGALITASERLSRPEASATEALAAAIQPLIAAVVLSILLIVAFDGLRARIESISEALDRLGAETVDAVAMSQSTELKPAPEPRSAPVESRSQRGFEPPRPHLFEANRGNDPQRRYPSDNRSPHQIRVDIPDAMIRALEHDDELYNL